jgi:hypothetical protein
MNPSITRLKLLLSGNPSPVLSWLEEKDFSWPLTCAGFIALGCGVYGFTLGLWRDPTQSLYTAIKFPLLIFLTCLGNAALNGVLAQVLGLRISFRETLLAILMSFVIAALILGAFSPVMLFLLYNTPPLEQKRGLGHSITLLSHVGVIAFAGVVANRRLLRLLECLSDSRALAWRILFAWLAGNLLLGSQLAWVLRPFVGSPGLPVEFLRHDPLRGNFFEAVAFALKRLLSA